MRFKEQRMIRNVFELLKYGKEIVVYFIPEKQFVTVSFLDDAKELLSKCDHLSGHQQEDQTLFRVG